MSDFIVIIAIALILFTGVELISNHAASTGRLNINLSIKSLIIYAVFSTARMFAAYILSFIFTILYGYFAIRSKIAEMILLPTLDVLQSVPILSFLPVVLLSLSVFIPVRIAAEIASIVLIFTSQVWNMTFGWYQSLKTIPKDLKEATKIFNINGWLKFKYLDLPFGSISLIWNSIMSWAGGWFFLMAAEYFSVGNKNFILPGIGSYLQQAANKKDLNAIIAGVITLIVIIVILDQFIWRPLLAWSERFKLQLTTGEFEYTSWFYNILLKSKIALKLLNFLLDKTMPLIIGRLPDYEEVKKEKKRAANPFLYLIGSIIIIVILWYVFKMVKTLSLINIHQWLEIFKDLLYTFLRVATALIIALLWTIPVGVSIGSNPKLAKWLQPIIQLAASIPATALFPVILLILIKAPGSLNTASIFLMLMGTQWYLLFNVIAGATAIPEDLKNIACSLNLSTFQKWKNLILPALFPYIITGVITAGGGAWNASIVAEYVNFGNKTIKVPGIGAMITYSTAKGNYPLLLASTIVMILAVVLINRLLWKPLYRLAEKRYHFD
ncbi:ABC transporter permease [Hippea jasoniae]|uniref:ABC transporter permease n=1 Tax=Hippea jasoniae TaxID=944479 RepID=UPI0018DD4988|nr:ABC transporter permease subunit [Hippea jasoniae]